MTTVEAFLIGMFAGMLLATGLYRLGGWLYDVTHQHHPAPRPPRES